MQGTRIQALVREDPTCRRATKPVCHNYWACALEPTSHNYWSLCSRVREPQLLSLRATTTEAHAPQLLSLRSRAREPQLLKPTCLEPVLLNERSHHNEKPAHCNEEYPPLAATRESPHAAMKTQRSQKINQLKQKTKTKTKTKPSSRFTKIRMQYIV